MGEFARDTDIGYPAADTSIVTVLERLETLITESSVPGNLSSLITGIGEQLAELIRIRDATEITAEIVGE